MRSVLLLLVTVPMLLSCEATQQIGSSAADNARPATAPVLTERPPLSSIWSNEPGKIYIGAKLFGVGVSHNLFNRISVKLDGRDAIELPRGTAGNFQPIDRSQLQTGNVYFRITVEQTDANQQTEVDALEIVDNVLRPLGTVALGQDVIEEQELVVRETSINPAYAGTADESRESTWTVSFSRNLSGPPGQGWRSRCDVSSFPPAFSQTSRSGLPGARVGYSFSSSRCKRLGVLRDGVRSNVIELATDADRYGDVFFDIPTDAQANSTIQFQIFGEDLLKRVSYFNAKALVQDPPPATPCPTNNGAAGNLIQFRFCGICGEERVPVQNFSCDSTEAPEAALDSLAEHENCNLFTGSCPDCPVTTEIPPDKSRYFRCVATPAGVFAWNISEVLQPACSSDTAKEFVELQTRIPRSRRASSKVFPSAHPVPDRPRAAT